LSYYKHAVIGRGGVGYLQHFKKSLVCLFKKIIFPVKLAMKSLMKIVLDLDNWTWTFSLKSQGWELRSRLCFLRTCLMSLSPFSLESNKMWEKCLEGSLISF